MFKFTEEMQLRLRSPRVAAGLIQRELAALLGRDGKGIHGKTPSSASGLQEGMGLVAVVIVRQCRGLGFKVVGRIGSRSESL